VAVGAGVLAAQIAADLQETGRIRWIRAGAKGVVAAIVIAVTRVLLESS
jgi:hypothetical protein